MRNIFEVFDENIGVDGYYEIIRNKLFPQSTSQSIDVVKLNLQSRTYPKGSIFSRARFLREEEIPRILNSNIKTDEFYPPNPNAASISEGRFNAAGQRTLYVTDHPFIAIKECEISNGDHFFLSYLAFSIDMHFVYVGPEKGDVSNLIYLLLQAKDKKFYQVVNRVNNEILKFSGYHGIAYDSTKVELNYKYDKWGYIGTNTNLAIAWEHVKNTRIEAAWLNFCGEGYFPIQRQLFLPLSKKKKNRMKMIDVMDGRSIFISESEKVMKILKARSKILNSSLYRNDYGEANKSPVKIIYKSG